MKQNGCKELMLSLGIIIVIMFQNIPFLKYSLIYFLDEMMKYLRFATNELGALRSKWGFL